MEEWSSWFKADDLKSSDGKPSGGSNPSSSASLGVKNES